MYSILLVAQTCDITAIGVIGRAWADSRLLLSNPMYCLCTTQVGADPRPG